MNEQLINLKLVQEVEKRPCLYNHQLMEYSRRDVTEEAWCEVGKTVNLTGSQSKEKWKNLRAVFVRNLKPSPKDAVGKKKKPYYLADAMKFTIPFIKALTTASRNLIDEHQEAMVDQIDDVDDDIQDDTDSLSSSPKKTKCEVDFDESTMSYFNAKKEKIEKLIDDVSENPRKMFLLSLLPDINDMSNAQMRTFKRRVLAVIDEILEETSPSQAYAGNE